jgi:Rad3-related DNA helicase
MLRSFLLALTSAVLMSTATARANDKSDCQKGVAMIKAELKKKHPERVLVTLLSDAELEEAEEDWSDCMKYVKTARAVLRK